MKQTFIPHFLVQIYFEAIVDICYMVFLVDLVDEYGNPIWKNRVESWKEKDKKKKKKKASPKAENQPPIPQEQEMEGKQ